MKLKFLKIIFYAFGILWIFTPNTADSKPGVSACSTCHVAITSEWRSSLHAQAYSSPVFLKRKEGTGDSAQGSCSCHGPDNIAPEFLGKVPQTRKDSLHLGVDCLACHMDKDMVAFSSGEQVTLDFDDEPGVQRVPLARAPGPSIEATWVKMIIEDVYPGFSYDDTCLGELQVWGGVR